MFNKDNQRMMVDYLEFKIAFDVTPIAVPTAFLKNIKSDICHVLLYTICYMDHMCDMVI